MCRSNTPPAGNVATGTGLPFFPEIPESTYSYAELQTEPDSAAVQEQKHDASTDIEALVKLFAEDMTKVAETLRTARVQANDAKAKEQPAVDANPTPTPKKKAEPAPVPVVVFTLSKAKASKVRTPAEQAQEIVEGQSWVCWSSHMSDKARHVLMKVDGEVSWDAKAAFGEDFAAFKKTWGETMQKHGLKNHKAGEGWSPGDEFHLELPDSKLQKSDERATACLDEYARLTRKEGQSKNAKFEEDYTDLLKPYFEKYEAQPETGKK